MQKKLTSQRLALITLAALSMGTVAHAQDAGSAWYLSPSISRLSPDTDWNPDKNATGLGLKLGRALSDHWDLQLGLRRELKPQARNYGVIGVRGLAPYAFDVDVAAFVRSDGRLFARTRAEYDMLFTNRLVARPFVGIDWATRSIPSDGIKAGATSSEWGLNLRYEITRDVAPYLEISRQWQRGADSGAGANSVRAGLRLVL